MNKKSPVLVGLILLALVQSAAAQETQPIVQRIDHVMAEVPDIEAVQRMQSLFADTLGLPVWFGPGLRRDFNRPTWDFYNTGVYVGGVFLEFLTFNVEEVTADSEPSLDSHAPVPA
jgi:catechol 2,3-dioxygenase-like lactoylglutathione lyase family enzyme